MAVADLVIRLQDRASNGIRGISDSLSGLRSRTNQAASATSGLTGAITQGVLQANAITFAVGKASEAIGFMNSKFNEAKDLQLEQLNAATTFSALTGQSAEQAGKFIQTLNDRLAKSAASLPGATAQYSALAMSISDNLVQAFKDPSGTLNQKGFEDTLASMAESFGALTAASTRDVGNTSLGLSKALAGASTNELRQIAFFEQNPAILNEIERRLSDQGKQLKDLNIRERVQMFEQIGQKFITDDFRRSASLSVDGLIQSFNSTLFDPSAGIFGIMRDLDPKTEGVQSAFSSLNETLIELIGPSGVFYQVSDILSAAGVELVSPMQLIKNAADFATRGLRQVNEGLTYIKDFIKAGGTMTEAFRLGTGLIQRTFNAQSISQNIVNFFNNLGSQVGPMLLSMADALGAMLNQGAISLGGSIDTGQLYAVGEAVGQFLGRFTAASIRFLSQVDYPQLLITIGRVAIGLAGAIAGGLAGYAQSVLPAIGGMLNNIGQSLLVGLENVILAVGQTIADGFNLITAPARSLIEFYMGSIGALFTDGFGGLFRFVIDFGRQKLSDIQNTLRSIPGIGALIPQVAPVQPVGASYAGNVGFAAGGFMGSLLGAAQQEIRRMPPGAELLVANSSETIIPQGMFGAAVRALAPTSGSSTNTFNIEINSNGDPQAIAQAVISEIQRRFDAEMQTQLA